MDDRHPKESQRGKACIQSSSGVPLWKLEAKNSLLQLFHFPARNFSMQMWQLCGRFDVPELIQPVPASPRCCLDLAVLPPLSGSTSRWLQGCSWDMLRPCQGEQQGTCVGQPGSCAPARNHLPLNVGAPQTRATTDEMANQSKLSRAATGGFLIQQPGFCNLESNIQLRRGCVFYLKDGIFLKALIWLSIPLP